MSSYGIATTPVSAAIVTSASEAPTSSPVKTGAPRARRGCGPARAGRGSGGSGRASQRPLAARRGDLERVVLADLREHAGDALAEVERHALGMVDEQPQRVTAEHLGEQHLDLRRALRQRGLDLGLHLSIPSPPLPRNT